VERGEGVDPTIELAGQSYRKTGSHLHLSELDNFGLCLEYDGAVGRDLARPAKYYHLAATFGSICKSCLQCRAIKIGKTM
jgi:hypothetical protein